MAGNYFLALLTICALTQAAWAKSCYSDSECPSNQLCKSYSCSRGYTGTGIRCNSSLNCTQLGYSSTCLVGECSCKYNFHCEIGENCYNGRCAIRNYECTTSSQCLGTKICYNNQCIYCSSHSQCPGSLYCINKSCRTYGSCDSHSDCPGTQRCIFTTCRSVSRNGRCSTSSDCPYDQSCDYYTNYCKDTSSTPSGGGGSGSGTFIFWGIVIFVAVLLKLICFGACRDTSTVVPPPRNLSQGRTIPVPNQRAPIRIQMPSSVASAPRPEPNFDSRPPAYNEAIAETPCTPPPAYNPFFKK